LYAGSVPSLCSRHKQPHTSLSSIEVIRDGVGIETTSDPQYKRCT